MRLSSRMSTVVASAVAVVGVLSIQASPAGAAGVAPGTQASALSQAEAAWPGAAFLPNGGAQGPGSFIVPLGSGFAHLVVTATVTKVVAASGDALALRLASAVGCSSGHLGDQCGRFGYYGCGTQVYGSLSQSLASAFDNWKIAQTVSYHVSVCHNSWDIQQSVHCSGVCIGSSSHGDICQGCGVVNPWYNQQIWPRTFYLRQYMGSDTSWTMWAN